jgi:hypothetical protein
VTERLATPIAPTIGYTHTASLFRGRQRQITRCAQIALTVASSTELARQLLLERASIATLDAVEPWSGCHLRRLAQYVRLWSSLGSVEAAAGAAWDAAS